MFWFYSKSFIINITIRFPTVIVRLVELSLNPSAFIWISAEESCHHQLRRVRDEHEQVNRITSMTSYETIMKDIHMYVMSYLNEDIFSEKANFDWRQQVTLVSLGQAVSDDVLWRDSWSWSRQEFHQLRWHRGLARARVRNIQHCPGLKTSQFVAFKPISTLCNEDTSILEFPGCVMAVLSLVLTLSHHRSVFRCHQEPGINWDMRPENTTHIRHSGRIRNGQLQRSVWCVYYTPLWLTISQDDSQDLSLIRDVIVGVGVMVSP